MHSRGTRFERLRMRPHDHIGWAPGPQGAGQPGVRQRPDSAAAGRPARRVRKIRDARVFERIADGLNMPGHAQIMLRLWTG